MLFRKAAIVSNVSNRQPRGRGVQRLTQRQCLSSWLTDHPDLLRIFAHRIRGSLMRRDEYRIVLPELNDLEELNMALSDRVEQ